MTRVVVLTGTPGTGKTAIGKILKGSGWKVLELNREIVKNKLYTRKDVGRNTFVADLPAVRAFVKDRTEVGQWVVVSHLAHLLPASMVSTVIVLRCQPDELTTRLKRKGWPAAKVKENVEAEMISLIPAEARQKHRNVYEIDTTGRRPAEVAKAVEKVLKGRGEIYRTAVEWLRRHRRRYII